MSTPTALAGRVVLVVDDNPAQRYVACRMLRNANFTTIEASWGRQVVEQARRLRPDIILLDMHMPDQSGIVTLQQLRADSSTASIPVVFLTATAHSPVDKSQAEELGVSAYLFNPVAPDTLVAVVENSIMRAKDVAQERDRALNDVKGVRGRWRSQIADDTAPRKNQQSDNYETIVDDAMALMRSDYASVQMLFPERGSGGELRLLAFRGFNPEAAKFWEWVRADSKCTCGIALRDKIRVVAPDIATCDFMVGSDDQRTYLQTGIRACQTTPLIGRGGILVGMISTHWRTPHQPSEREFQLFDTLARQAADLIESFREDGESPSSECPIIS